MTFIKNWNFFLCLLLNKIGLKIMFADHPVRKEAFFEKKGFCQAALYRYFLKGLTHNFGQKLEFISLLAFEQNRP